MRVTLLAALLLGGCVLDFDADKLDPVSRWTFLDATQHETCLIDRAGTVTCVGTNGEVYDAESRYRRTFTLPEPAERVDVGAYGGGAHNLAITTSGALYGWGANGDFELGLGRMGAVRTPELIDEGPWLEAEGEGAFSVGLKADGTLWGWGWGGTNSDQHGIEGPTLMTPTRVDSRSDYRELAVGDNHGCALLEDGELWCWGDTSDGRIARVGPRAPPMRSAGEYDSISLGAGHGCGIRGGQLHCWGLNDRGQLARPSAELASSRVPLRVGEASDWRVVSAGGAHTCGIRGESLYCWGANERSQLGLGADRAMAELPTPTQVEGEGYRLVAAGGEHTCATRRVDGLVCFGSNSSGQIYLDDFARVYAFPTAVVIEPE